MSTHHRAAKVATVAALALTANAALATAPAHAAPPYLSMSSPIRMAVSDSTVSPGGNYMAQVVYVEGLVSMSQAAAQDTIDHHNDILALRYWGDEHQRRRPPFWARHCRYLYLRGARRPALRARYRADTRPAGRRQRVIGEHRRRRLRRDLRRCTLPGPQRQHPLEGGEQPHHRRSLTRVVAVRMARSIPGQSLQLRTGCSSTSHLPAFSWTRTAGPSTIWPTTAELRFTPVRVCATPPARRCPRWRATATWTGSDPDPAATPRPVVHPLRRHRITLTPNTYQVPTMSMFAIAPSWHGLKFVVPENPY